MKEDRREKIQSELKKQISNIIHNKLRDKRISGFISITRVILSPDGRHAKIFVLSYKNKVREEKVLEVLNNAQGVIRSYLAKDLNLRHTPKLSFYIDKAIREGDKVIELINKLNYGEVK